METIENIDNELLELINELFPDKNFQSINVFDNLTEKFGFDSLDFLDIVMEVQQKYKMEIHFKYYPSLTSIRGFSEIIFKLKDGS